MDYIVPTGPGTGQPLGVLFDANVAAVVEVAGYMRNGAFFEHRFNDFVLSTWEQRDTCGCDGYGVWRKHGPHCYMYGLAATLEASYERMARVILDDAVTFKEARYQKPWLAFRRDHPAFVAAATEALTTGQRCWWCGGRLVAIGSARKNGAWHDDWDARRLHKRCFTELV